MSLNQRTGDTSYSGKRIARVDAMWAAHHLSDSLWRDLRGLHADANRSAWLADRCAKQCWETQTLTVPRDSYASTCECVETVLS